MEYLKTTIITEWNILNDDLLICTRYQIADLINNAYVFDFDYRFMDFEKKCYTGSPYNKLPVSLLSGIEVLRYSDQKHMTSILPSRLPTSIRQNA